MHLSRTTAESVPETITQTAEETTKKEEGSAADRTALHKTPTTVTALLATEGVRTTSQTAAQSHPDPNASGVFLT